MKYYKKLEGKNIYLSPMNIDDAYDFTEWICDRRTSDGINNTCKVYNVESEKAWISEVLAKNLPSFSIILKDGDKLIGNCGLMDVNNLHGTASIGIMIGKEEYRSLGYGKEALKLLIDYGFNILNLHNINLGVFSFNKRAIACYKKVGFTEYGRRHACYYLDGKYHDELLMEVIKSDN